MAMICARTVRVGATKKREEVCVCVCICGGACINMERNINYGPKMLLL